MAEEAEGHTTGETAKDGNIETPIEQEPMEELVEVPKVKKSTFKRIKSSLSFEKILSSSVTLIAIGIVMYIAIFVRSSTLDAPTVLDYDPWWWYRHAETLLENNMIMPKWDFLSHYPPGRPVEAHHGWSYTIAIIYKIMNPLVGWTLTKAAQWSTLIFAALTVIPAFLLGRRLSNRWGGIATAIFGVLTPALIGVSVAGYCDTDMAVVFYTFLSVYSLILAMETKISKAAIPYYIFSIIVNILFVFTWGFGWVLQMLFLGFIPAYFVFRIVEKSVHDRKLKININELKREASFAIPILVILGIVNVVGTVAGWTNVFSTMVLGFQFWTGQSNIVNISVAELQTMNIFSQAGFNSLVGRIGFAPAVFILGIWPLPLLTSPLFLYAIYKLYKRQNLTKTEIYMYIWTVATFAMITRGVRFSLLFSVATAASSGYIIGNVLRLLDNKFLKASFTGLVILLLVMFISDATTIGYQTSGMRISDNWYNMLDWLKNNADPDSLIVTWWDPGHIIAGYTGLAVHADGAHCGVTSCVPYAHNDRIQDMGRTFAISSEEEAIEILSKYRELTDEQCTDSKDFIDNEYGDIFPDEACKPISDMYVIASNDLIGKYYWLSYFGTGTGRNYFQLQITNYDQEQGVIEYNGGQLRLVWEDGIWVPVFNIPEQGIRNVIINDVVYYENGLQNRQSFRDRQNTIDGMVWVDPGYSVAIFMDGPIRDSIFTKMFFFNGEGLEHFELVLNNPEIRLYKVIW